MFSGLLFLKNSFMSGEKVEFHTPLAITLSRHRYLPRATRGAVLGNPPMTESWAMHLGSHDQTRTARPVRESTVGVAAQGRSRCQRRIG